MMRKYILFHVLVFMAGLLIAVSSAEAYKNLPFDPEVDDSSDYENFISKNTEFSKKRSIKDFILEYNKAVEFMSQEKRQEREIPDIGGKLMDDLNIRFLVDRIEEVSVSAEIVEEKRYRNYDQKKIKLIEENVGTFFISLLIPSRTEKKLPVIIGLHGHGDTSNSFKNSYFMEDLVSGGFAVAMVSFRASHHHVDDLISPLLYMNGFTLMGLHVYETLLVVEYLKDQAYIDSGKIGLMGHSMGSCVSKLVSRISSDIKAGVFDTVAHFLTFPPFHCETLPALAFYRNQINDIDTLPFPAKQCSYCYPDKTSREDIVVFFKQILQGKKKNIGHDINKRAEKEQ